MVQLLNPKLDVVFKLLFADPRNQQLLCALLNAILEPAAPITEVTVLNPEIPRETTWEKGVWLDLRARLADGTYVNVEMQMAPQPAQRERALFYWAKNYAGQLQRGDTYVALAPAISVLILNYIELPWAEYHSVFRVLESTTGRALSDDLEIHVLQLPKLSQHLPPASAPAVVRWGLFFAAESEQQLEQLAMHDPNLREAKDALERLSADPAAQQLATDRELAAYFHQRNLQLSGLEGEARGEARALLTVLEARGISLTDAQRARVTECTDREQLERWLRRAALIASANELFT